MRELEILQAIYRAIAWDKLYELKPDISREQIDEFFRSLRNSIEQREIELSVPEKSDRKQETEETPDDMILNCDGSSRGNPGSAGIGMVLKAPGGKELQSWGSPIGKATNNVAEYKALLAGLKRALKLKCRNITIRSDSQLLVRQLTGQYRVKNRTLAKLHKAAHKLLVEFDNWSAEHVPREENKEADKIAQKQSKKAKKDNS